MTGRVLVVDDEPAIRDIVGYALKREGFDVREAADGDAALASARGEPFDVVILDLMLPKLSGTEVCRALRAESDVPILILTAKDEEVDRVLGLELGADDYVTKPFSAAELVSRVRAILRRRELDRRAAGSALIEAGGIQLDFARYEVRVDGEPVHLTPSEFKVLALLVRDPGRVFSRRQIMEHLWQSPYIGDERASDVHISSLRRKIERDPSRPERILTVRGLGYKLAAV
ncbi:MAG TPA: response regulator transcription factor [Gaiellaceae bacterium]|nr:response regulator transcription factor [Gaiellaceae bacterium]